MTDDLNRLRAVAEAATPGPWYRNSGLIWGHDNAVVTDTRNLRLDDAVHIATFDPPTVLALLDRAERAETERDRLEAAYTAEGACGAIGCRAIDQRDALWAGLSALVDQAEKDGQGIYIDAGRTHVTAVETGLLRSLLAAAPTETEGENA